MSITHIVCWPTTSVERWVSCGTACGTELRDEDWATWQKLVTGDDDWATLWQKLVTGDDDWATLWQKLVTGFLCCC
eukprot:364861-Chlamydomonas_euryale.AAC.25